MQIPFTESELTSISYGIMSSFGFMLMLFVYNYCKYNTVARPHEADTQFDAALMETSTSIPFVSKIVEQLENWIYGPLHTPEPEPEPAPEPALKPAVAINKPIRFIIHGNPRPIQPKRTVSCPAIYQGATAFSPISDSGDFFFADLPSPASAP